MNFAHKRSVYNWLMLGCILVVTMVVVGGITRLTQSGLSMVKWEPIIGIIPPLSEEAWQSEFDLYKETPEFRVFNNDFTLSDYKRIYFWEYIHRVLGRLIGLVFLIPFLVFWKKGYFNTKLIKPLLIIFLGGAFQGFLGWFMVKSGLSDRPNVSHYRLAAHLITATSLAVYIFWVALGVKEVKRFALPALKKFLLFLLFFVALQLLFGAFVAGLKAGKIYTTFPKMGYQWIPIELADDFSQKGLLALFESHGVVQLIHRLNGIFVLILASVAWFRFRNIHPEIKFSLNVFVGMVWLQVILGIFTLVYSVPVTLGVLHQWVAILLILSLFYLLYRASSSKA